MEALDDRLMAALRDASDDLGFRLQSPFEAIHTDGETVLVEGYLPDFGGPDGIVLVSFQRRLKLAALQLPMSILPKESRHYVRKHMIADLSDFGWYGKGARPAWLKC